MNAEELEKLINIKLIESGQKTQRNAAGILGMEQSNFNRKLKKGNFSYLEVVRLAEGLGYRIEWIKK